MASREQLPLPLSYEPMEATLVTELPVGASWQYEPKWDGFRCLAFRNGDRIDLQSKSGRPLTRYFPDLVDALRQLSPTTFVLDGEIVVPVGRQLSFDELLLRIHPAASRVNMLANEHPAMFIVFDELVDEAGDAIVERPLSDRRAMLERFASAYFPRGGRILLSPAVREPSAVQRWLRSLGAGLDGIVAKRFDLPYQSGNRNGMRKVKTLRTADCVVGGFRYASAGRHAIGSLLLGLYDDDGVLHHVGFSSSFDAKEKRDLVAELKPHMGGPGFTGHAPGGPSRWSTDRSGEWEPLRPELIAEVQYDHFSGGRFRHGTTFLRWRPDKAPSQCTLDQVKHRTSSPLALLTVARKAASTEARKRKR